MRKLVIGALTTSVLIVMGGLRVVDLQRSRAETLQAAESRAANLALIMSQYVSETQSVDVGEVVKNAVEAVAPAIDAKTIQLQVQIEAGVGSIPGDPERLQQIVWNLLSNAVKFTPQGGRVGVSLARRDDSVLIAVSDTGTGIQPDFLPHVFERFRQQQSGTSRRHGGLGLGLAIVRNLVELHGGSITAHSDGEGRGALFTVRLPAAARHA